MIMKDVLFLTADKEKAVYRTDRRGCEPFPFKRGDKIDQKTADKYGIVDGRLSAIRPVKPEQSKK